MVQLSITPCAQCALQAATLLSWSSIQVQTKLLAPIAPHWAEHVWGELLRREGLVITAGWPQQPARGVDGALQLQRCSPGCAGHHGSCTAFAYNRQHSIRWSA